ncbi:Type IV secretion system protein virB9 [Escherichia coli]|nr:Type IV secretion system protein virB9 [Escherichia coli]
MKKLTFTALALMMCGAAWGAAIPQASRYDSRVQQVIYNPQNVTVVNTKPGFMTTLVFDNDEAVISAKPGFDEAREATPMQTGQRSPGRAHAGAPEKMATQRRS